jgi:hypothetical protein
LTTIALLAASAGSSVIPATWGIGQLQHDPEILMAAARYLIRHRQEEEEEEEEEEGGGRSPVNSEVAVPGG